MIRKLTCFASSTVLFLCAMLGAQTPPAAQKKVGQTPTPQSTTKSDAKSLQKNAPAQPTAKDSTPALTPEDAAILQWKPGDELPPLPESAEANMDNPCELAGFRLQRLFTNYRDALKTGVPNSALQEKIRQTLATGTQAAHSMEKLIGAPSDQSTHVVFTRAGIVVNMDMDGFIASMFARDARTNCDGLAAKYERFSPSQPEAYSKWKSDVMPAQQSCSGNLIALSEYCKPGVGRR